LTLDDFVVTNQISIYFVLARIQNLLGIIYVLLYGAGVTRNFDDGQKRNFFWR